MQRCAFCREPLPETQEESEKRRMKRITKNCPVALREEDTMHCAEEDYKKAVEYLVKAADFGDAGAHFNLSCLHRDGDGVEKDEEKTIYHWEEAAIAGHPSARYNLGITEWNNGNFERAKKHLLIAANLGHNDSLNCVKDLYADDHASKEEYAAALRA